MKSFQRCSTTIPDDFRESKNGSHPLTEMPYVSGRRGIRTPIVIRFLWVNIWPHFTHAPVHAWCESTGYPLLPSLLLRGYHLWCESNSAYHLLISFWWEIPVIYHYTCKNGSDVILGKLMVWSRPTGKITELKKIFFIELKTHHITENRTLKERERTDVYVSNSDIAGCDAL